MAKDDGQGRLSERRRLSRRTVVRLAALTATLADAARGQVAVAAMKTSDTDILRLCLVVHELDQAGAGEGAELFDALLYKISDIPSQHHLALLAKAQLLLSLLPYEGTGRRQSRASPEEALLASLLRDLLATEPLPGMPHQTPE